MDAVTGPKPNSLMAAHEFAVSCEAVQDVLGIPKDDIKQLSRPTHDDWKLNVHLKDGTTTSFDLTPEQNRDLTSYYIHNLNRPVYPR
jgi:hypothetical protein